MVLYKKYNFENPNQNISLSLFQSCRPKNVLPVSYASRKVCLCKTHQNVALRLRVLRSQGVQQSTDHSIKKETSESLAVKIDALSNHTVTFQVWKQVVRPHKDTTIKKTRRRQFRNQNSKKISWRAWIHSYSTPKE